MSAPAAKRPIYSHHRCSVVYDHSSSAAVLASASASASSDRSSSDFDLDLASNPDAEPQPAVYDLFELSAELDANALTWRALPDPTSASFDSDLNRGHGPGYPLEHSTQSSAEAGAVPDSFQHLNHPEALSQHASVPAALLHQPPLRRPPGECVSPDCSVASATQMPSAPLTGTNLPAPRASKVGAHGLIKQESTLSDDESVCESWPSLATFEHLDPVNPFLDNAVDRIPAIGSPRPLENGEVNGYIKFRSRNNGQHSRYPMLQSTIPCFSPEVKADPPPPTVVCPQGSHAAGRTIARLPPAFGLGGLRLTGMDQNLFDFYRKAWCAGRAVLDATNCWLLNIASMASQSSSVKHAMLALAGTYVLDYLPDERVRQRSNDHYYTAVTLLTNVLRDESEHRPGHGEAVVATIALLNMLDVVSPERRRPKNHNPRWFQGAELACKLLDVTDPGHRYWDPAQVQPSEARVANTILASRAVILTLPMIPLDPDNTDNERFQWLLAQAMESHTRRIHGGCGCSPRLLHRFAQITHLAMLQQGDPSSVLVPQVGAPAILQELRDLRQWSELGPYGGYASCEALLINCDKDLNLASGVVHDKASMTNLTAEAWRQAAIIYLLCRLLRLPRSHDEVATHMTRLAACIDRMPTSGPLFTAQAPFFPVFLLGLLASSANPEHYDCAQRWFESVTRTSCRSSVPPAYESLKRIRVWMAINLPEHENLPVAEDVGERKAWWEDLVAHVEQEEGILCLI